jgi:hypothetical protein
MNYTCGRFRSETDVTASVTAAVILLALAFATAVALYCAFRGWIRVPACATKSGPIEFKLLDDDDDGNELDVDTVHAGLITAESTVGESPPMNDM